MSVPIGANGALSGFQENKSEERQDALQWQAPTLTVVIPTFNERDNIGPLLANLGIALAGTAWEAIIVDDDSPDGTAETAKQLALRLPNLRCIRRVGRRGLSSACIEGILASAAPFVAVIDADHQHDEKILPRMLAEAQDGADLVVGSRYTGGGSVGAGFSMRRHSGSLLATRLSNLVAGSRTTDPLSGFFLMRRSLFDAVAPGLAEEGFKILLDVIVSATRSGQDIKVTDVPYTFRQRLTGDSKMSPTVTIQFLGLWLSKLTGGVIPASFLLFAMVGASGIVVHMGVLSLSLFQFGFNFTNAQIAATLTAMTWNFFLNNELTYADRKLRGKKMLLGMLSFYAVCSLGAIANISVASVIYSVRPAAFAAGFAGAIMSSVFNYAVTRITTWR